MAPSAAHAVGWGINLDGAVTADPPAFSYQSNPYFSELVGGSACSGAATTRAICYARINVPWDAVSDGRGSFASCDRSRALFIGCFSSRAKRVSSMIP